MKKYLLMALSAIVMGFAACTEKNAPDSERGQNNSNPEQGSGNEEDPQVSGGALIGKFSVAEGKQVYFSCGNLQYQAQTETWRFATHQYDTIGIANSKVSAIYNGWIDLFGWGTSGYNDKFPYMTNPEPSDYGDGDNDIAGTEYDWGVHNAISNGGNQAGLWRTLTSEEWKYLFYTRNEANSLRGPATVLGVHGYIFLPDNWGDVEGVTFEASPNNWTANDYNENQWNTLERHGAVFLPAAGARTRITLETYNVNAEGYYWTSTSWEETANERAIVVWFYDRYASPAHTNSRFIANSVRLVQDVK